MTVVGSDSGGGEGDVVAMVRVGSLVAGVVVLQGVDAVDGEAMVER